jgi:hypothetical protein
LRFVWRGRVVEIQAEVTRAADSESGLHFLQDNEVLRELIAQSAAEVLRAQQANLQGNRESNLVGDETLTAASAGLRGKGFVTWTLEDKEWKKRQSLLPDQPPNGFTVSATEPPEQVEMLRLTWERGDEAARNMTRLLAELSASQLIRKK